MADFAHTTNLSRRRALLGVSTGIAAANIPGMAAGVALGSSDPEADAELFAAWREYMRLEAEMNAADDARDDVSAGARRAYPPQPECVARGWVRIVSDEEAHDGRGYIAVDTRQEVNPRWEESGMQMDEAEAWIKECEASQERFGVPAAGTAYEAAEEKYRAAFDRFLASPAHTPTGMAFKTSAILNSTMRLSMPGKEA